MKQDMQPISIVVPALNEADNLPLLVQRVAEPLVQAGIVYEVLIVDDHSTDNSVQVIKQLSETYNVRVILKQGKRGKAYSLLEGFEQVQYDLICMIDADLQYPPEAILPMYQQLLANNADVVVTNRVEQKTSFMRQLSTKVFHFLMARMLFGIDYDTQSGLKLFKKEVLDGMELKPSAWSFDLEFLIRSLEKHCRILSYEIPFGERYSGETKVNLLSGAYSTAIASVKLRMNSSIPKVRRGYRASMELSRRPAAMAALVIGGSLFGAVSISAIHTSPASALSLNDIVQNIFGSSDDKKAAQPAASPSNDPATGDTAQTPAATQQAATPAAQPTAQPTSTTRSSSTTDTQQPQQVAATRSGNTAQPASQTASGNADGTDYYASQSLSSSRTDQLLSWAKAVAVVGLVAIVCGSLLWVGRHLYQRQRRKTSRNLYRV